MTTFYEAKTEIYNLIKTGWGNTTPIVYDVLSYIPSARNPYIHVSINAVNIESDSGFIGNKYFKMHGSIIIEIYTIFGISSQLIDGYAQSAINVLRRNTQYVTILTPSIVTVPKQVDDGWYNVNVMASFYYFDLNTN